MFKKIIFHIYFLFLFFTLNPVLSANAQVLSSDNFQIVDSIIGTVGGYSTSDNFILIQSAGELSTGTSSATTFQINAGSLTYPAEEAAPEEEEEEEEVVDTTGGILGGIGTPLNRVIPILIPIVPILFPIPPVPIIVQEADLDEDRRVGFRDLSIFLYYSNPLTFKLERADINRDGAVNFKDLSAIFYAWTEPTGIAGDGEVADSADEFFDVEEGSIDSEQSFDSRTQGAGALSFYGDEGEKTNIASEEAEEGEQMGFVRRSVQMFTGLFKKLIQFTFGVIY